MILFLAAAVYFLAPGVRPAVDRKYAETQHRKKVNDLHLMQDAGKLRILVPDDEI